MHAIRVGVRLGLSVSLLLAAVAVSGCAILEVMMEGIDAYEPLPAESTSTAFYDTGDEAPASVGADDSPASGVVFDNQNLLAVENGGTPPTFTLSDESVITQIETYHWNDAAGNSAGGTVSLRAEDGTIYGPWNTTGRPPGGDTPNVYWTASPNVTIPAGIYTVIDSDPGTWSQNADSGGKGFTKVTARTAP